MMPSKIIKGTKTKKLTPIKTIHNRLYRLASLACRERAGNKCEVCSSEGKIDCHHIISRNIKDCPLKWDLRNLAALCPSHHKFGSLAAHNNPVFFIDWLIKNRSCDYDFLLDNMNFRCNLSDRDTLEYIEHCLTNNKNLVWK